MVDTLIERQVMELFGFGRLRDECLNVEWFKNLREAVTVIESWRRHYNK